MPLVSQSLFLFFFFTFSILARTLVPSFYFRRRGISVWFPGRSAPLFDLPIVSFFFTFFPFRQPWERLGMERERRGDITVGFSHGKRLAESPLC